jgi:hypothetical protein
MTPAIRSKAHEQRPMVIVVENVVEVSKLANATV